MYREIGELNPNVRSIVAYNTDSKSNQYTSFKWNIAGQYCTAGKFISGHLP